MFQAGQMPQGILPHGMAQKWDMGIILSKQVVYIFGYLTKMKKMKKTVIAFLGLLIIYSFTDYKPKKFIEKISLTNFSYNIYSEEKFLHDDNLNAEFFVIYKDKQKKVQCSSFMSAKRNDTTFKKGSYSYGNNRIIFKEYNYNHQNERIVDSMIKVFTPNKSGNLILKEVTEFKNGKLRKVK